ncbi:uncharacterized protein LOC121380624 [Gigantopelta aegis]|uniref:uncharacterized protein LOC121380624 n=1 Tax=Gigantopelta aegis TaxID=1735272 RepID=UPI001B88878F|nr:uncharacterized protein LOC121380624 [Gigantopelta aegis]
MSVAHVKQEPLDSFDVDMKNDSYENAGSSGHVSVLKGDNQKPINQDEMLHVMSIINRCEQESVSPGSDDTRTNGQFTVNGGDGDFKHECCICNARFKSSRAFRGHGVMHRLGFDPVKRRISSSEVTQDSGSQYCRKNGFDDSPFKCDNCHAVFGSRDTYAMHMLMRAKDENCKARAQAIGIDVDASPSGQMSKSVKMADGGLYNLKDVSNDTNKLFSDYKGLMPTYAPSCADAREILACPQCGEVFPSKDTLAMHAMFHTHDKEQQPKPTRWAIVYSSPVTGLVRSPNPAVMQAMTPELLHHNESSNSSSRRLDVGQDHGATGLSNSPTADQGLDLSIGSPRGTAGQSASTSNSSSSSSSSNHKQHVSKISDVIGVVTKQDGDDGVDLSSSVEHSPQLSKNEVTNTLFSYPLKSPEPASTQLRAVSADSGAVRFQAQGVLDVKVESSIENALHRPKSTDCGTIGRKDNREKTQQNVSSPLSGRLEKAELAGLPGEHQSDIMNRMRQLRKSRYPMRKLPYGYHPLSRPWRQPERKQVEESSTKPDVPNYTAAAHSSGSSNPNQGIAQMLNLKAKDFSYCKYCEIVYLDRTLFQLHMGLHNVNNPWQCNACGKVCGNRLDFSSHVLHY